jgi:hypothetical protein
MLWPNYLLAWWKMMYDVRKATTLLLELPACMGCPSTILGMEQNAYADPFLRSALDAWDCGLVTKRDLRAMATFRILMEQRKLRWTPEPPRISPSRP